MSTTGFTVPIKPLEGVLDYPYWAKQMKLLFEANDLDDFLSERDFNAASKPEKRLRAQALLLIYTSVSEPIRGLLFHQYYNQQPWTAWETLRKCYCSESEDTDFKSLKKLTKLTSKYKLDDTKILDAIEPHLERLENASKEHLVGLLARIGCHRVEKLKDYVESCDGDQRVDDIFQALCKICELSLI